jgi:hypothetical protein
MSAAADRPAKDLMASPVDDLGVDDVVAANHQASRGLRARLLALRSEALRQLADGDGVDAGMLALVAHAGVALDALDDVPADAEPAARAIVVDIPGEPVVLTLYSPDGRVAAVDLGPERAVSLASELIRAALPRLPR